MGGRGVISLAGFAGVMALPRAQPHNGKQPNATLAQNLRMAAKYIDGAYCAATAESPQNAPTAWERGATSAGSPHAAPAYVSSNPRIVPVLVAKLSSSMPSRCNTETNRFGSG